MRRDLLIPLFGGALIVSGLMLQSTAAPAAGDKKTVEGELLDLHCYSAGGAKGEEHGKTCGMACAKSGIPVAVLVEGKAWTLATNPRPLAESVGKTVKVTGAQNTETQAITADKVEVKDGETWKEVALKDAHHKGGAGAEEKK
jgi:hypothetical protein